MVEKTTCVSVTFFHPKKPLHKHLKFGSHSVGKPVYEFIYIWCNQMDKVPIHKNVKKG
jgi:hypothetical protein